MAELDYSEKESIEKLFGMRSGYVLDFSDRTFKDFVGSITGKDISIDKYAANGTSKANRFRTFLKEESNYDVAKLVENLAAIAMKKYSNDNPPNDETMTHYEACIKAAKRLIGGGVVSHIEALAPNNDTKDFKLLAKTLKESIEKNEPELALDRLHTFCVKYIRELCDKHNIAYDKAETLNAVYSKYIRFLVESKKLESGMSEKILKYSINIMEAFNDIRNNKSLAHDNPVLNYDESVLIFNNLTNAIKFIQCIEERNDPPKAATIKSEVPF